MEQLVTELLRRITGKGDIGAAALGFVAVYVLELKFVFLGSKPGTAAVLGMIGALGVKNIAESVWEWVSAPFARRRELNRNADEIEKLKVDNDTRLQSALNRVRSDRPLWDCGLISDQEFKGSISNFVDRYRRLQYASKEVPVGADASSRAVGPLD